MRANCYKLYEQANNELPKNNESFNRLDEITKRAIQDEQDNYNECKALLNKLDDERHYNVIYLRYFKGLTNGEVATETFYSISYTTRLTNWATNELEQIASKERS